MIAAGVDHDHRVRGGFDDLPKARFALFERFLRAESRLRPL